MQRDLGALKAPARGIEPRIAEPKSAVLPLHHAGMVLSGKAKELAPSPLNKQHALALLLVVAPGSVVSSSAPWSCASLLSFS